MFLEKLIHEISAACPSLVILANPGMIGRNFFYFGESILVAGLEPEKTNHLLHQLYLVSVARMPLEWQLSLSLKRLEFLTPKLFETFKSDYNRI